MDKKRIHNVLFHLHTVSGIVISAVLFIIFFAGAFTMFNEEIKVWEQGYHHKLALTEVDFDRIYQKLGEDYNLTGRNLNFVMNGGGNDMYVFVDHSHAPNASAEDLETHAVDIDIQDYQLLTYEQGYSYSEFIYRLHFLSQLPYIGMYLAGLVSFFFLFALLTGLYIHWDKIVKNFVLFRPHTKWKTIWTDMHTVLGTIAFPFQFIFSVTGAYFCLSVLVLLPAYSLYNNDSEKLMNEMRPERAHAIWEEVSAQEPQSINKFIASNPEPFQDFEILTLAIENIQGTNMAYKVMGDSSDKVNFTGRGSYRVDAYTLDTIKVYDPMDTAYITQIQRLLGRLHFGDYGGTFTQVIYAFLAFLTCVIIISGVMIWLTARDKNNVPEKRRKFNRKVVNVYLSICLSMIPVTAMGFIAAKLLPVDLIDNRQVYFYVVYFIPWLGMTVYFIFKDNFRYALRANLVLGGVLFLLVPIVNGIISGNWIWITIKSHLIDIFIVDVFCFLVGTISLLIYSNLPKTNSRHS